MNKNQTEILAMMISIIAPVLSIALNIAGHITRDTALCIQLAAFFVSIVMVIKAPSTMQNRFNARGAK
ncbi:hypothetical protein ATN89_17590 [Comamonas thiooxydans]|uniref:hypothetical protein n=1 Tax=Comamonas thiooxydans TaxID=363952 RepID=UPI0007C4DBCE|nr:hypothetical protein [Comamonas thiooxydans]OAD82895.1 hypothetical protein ATN89_17590 [Comamonas thiooxydans]